MIINVKTVYDIIKENNNFAYSSIIPEENYKI